MLHCVYLVWPDLLRCCCIFIFVRNTLTKPNSPTGFLPYLSLKFEGRRHVDCLTLDFFFMFACLLLTILWPVCFRHAVALRMWWNNPRTSVTVFSFTFCNTYQCSRCMLYSVSEGAVQCSHLWYWTHKAVCTAKPHRHLVIWRILGFLLPWI